jgi:ribosomal protein L11 methyltransferase
MKWVEIAVDAAPDSRDAASNVLIEEGCAGTASGPDSRVLGYLPIDDRLEARLEAIRSRIVHLPEFGLPLQSTDITVRFVEDDGWATAWKQFFKPVRIGRIVVKPSWEDFTAGPDDVIIDLDPGMAFGTGYHPTTQMCLAILQDLIHGGETVLDVGTGSGILAIAAIKLGAARAAGIDVDSVAVEVALENVNREGLRDKIETVRADSPAEFEGQADVVVANIIARTIIQMAADLRDKVRPGGYLITSGIIDERADEVRNALEPLGLVTEDVRRDGEWAALISRRAK